MELQEICREMDSLARSKGWYSESSEKPQTPKNLAISLLMEVCELVECFQWKEQPDLALVEDELADVILYAAHLANVTGAKLDQGVRRKINRNQARWAAAAGGKE